MPSWKISSYVVMLIAVIFTAAGMRVQAEDDAAPPKIKVVCSFSILEDIVANVGGDRVAVSSLIARGKDPHAFKPTPADAERIAVADIVVLNGLGFDTLIRKLIDASGYRGRIVIASNGVQPLIRSLHAHSGDVPGLESNAGHADSGKPAAHAGDDDPHAWMDVANGIQYAKNIRDALRAEDPDHADDYTMWAELYIGQLRIVNSWIKKQLAAIPVERRGIVTAHAAFNYFAKAYRIKVLSLQGVTTQDNPNAKTVAALIDHLRSERITAIFAETTNNPKAIRQVAEQTGAKLLGDLFVGSLSARGTEADSYINLLKTDVTKIVRALR